jgi:DNA polymerase III subunit delta'
MHNWGIIGHTWAIDWLERSLANGRAAHAYLISGSPQIGKALLALRLAQVLNCEQSSVRPCLACRSCKRIERGNHPDVRIASLATQAAQAKGEEASRQRNLKIDTIREWQADITLKPYEGKRRIFILHDAERLSEAAANAMLKTLEEPPLYATLILVANTAGDLMQTIVSRCQPIKLRPVARPELIVALAQRGMLAGDAQLLASWSGGRPGWALRMIETPDDLATQQAVLDELAQLTSRNRPLALKWADEQAKLFRGGEQETVYSTLDVWQSWWRDVLMVAAGCPEAITHVDRADQLATTAKTYSIQHIHGILRHINLATQQLRENANPQLVLENITLHI